MERRSGFGDAMSVIGSMLFGALIGAAVALLMAPKSGTELRSELKEGAQRMGERMSGARQDVAETVRCKINKMASTAESLGDRVEEIGDESIGEADDPTDV